MCHFRDGFGRWRRLADVGRTSCLQHRAAASCHSALGAHCVNDLRILLGRNAVALRPGRVFDTILKCQAVLYIFMQQQTSLMHSPGTGMQLTL